MEATYRFQTILQEPETAQPNLQLMKVHAETTNKPHAQGNELLQPLRSKA